MKKIILKGAILSTSALIISILYFNRQTTTVPLSELLSSYADPGMKIKIRSPFSGSVLVAKKGKVVFKEAYGMANRDTNLTNKVNSKFGIGSVTKQFTALLVMQKVAEGYLSLSDTIAKHLPYLSEHWSQKVTVHQLLSHTAGLPHYEGLSALGISLNDFGSRQFTPQSLAQLISDTKLINEPGTYYSYSSFGYILLGAILEEVSGKSYSALLNESIIQPLGLKNTGLATNRIVETELSTGYVYKEAYGWDWWSSENGGTLSPAPFRDQSTTYSTGGIYSTVEDLFIWSEAIKNHTLLSPSHTRTMLTPNKHGYCYAWVRNFDDIVEKNINARLYGHGGALAGNSAYVAMYDDETTIIYLANVSNIKAEEMIHQLYLSANDLEDKYKLTGYPNRSNLSTFEEAGGMKSIDDYFGRLSEYSGYLVHPSKYTMSGLMQIHLEGNKPRVADSLKNAFLTIHHPNQETINDIGYRFLASDYPEFSLDFFRKNVERFPFSSNAWDSLGEAHLALGDIEESINCYTKAVEIGERLTHPALDYYREGLKKAKAKE